MKNIFWLAALLFFAAPGAEAGANQYVQNIGRDWNRGLKNMVTAPLEIPVAMQEYHEQAGRPFVRQSAGFVDGVFRTITRFSSGALDLVTAFIPGDQEGLPPHPETLF